MTPSILKGFMDKHGYARNAFGRAAGLLAPGVEGTGAAMAKAALELGPGNRVAITPESTAAAAHQIEPVEAAAAETEVAAELDESDTQPPS